MARETKQDRIVRGMTDQFLEHLHELKALNANSDSKEADVERWCQSLMRSCLGYSASNGYTFRVQENRGRLRPDMVIMKHDVAVCVIEVKKLDADLNKTDMRSGKIQLKEYLKDFAGVKWGFLTNGFEWRLFDFSDPTSGGVNLLTLDMRSDEGEIDISKRMVEDLCYDFSDIHESKFGSEDWKQLYKEANAFSPESLAKAILSVDVVRVVSKTIRGEHEYKANIEALYDKLSHLVVRGLNDADHGWNETKQLELTKFTRSQVKSAKRKRRAAAKKASDATSSEAEASASVETAPTVTTPTNGSSSDSAA